MGVGQMDVAAVVLVCPLLVSIQALGLPYVELVSVRRGLELIELSPEQRERLTRDLAVDEAAIEQLAS